MLVGALAYALHLISIPAGWSPADEASDIVSIGPPGMSIGGNGSVAVILAPATKGAQPSRILIVRSDGTKTLLKAESSAAEAIFRRRFRQSPHCLTEGADCPAFGNVALARDGTPFVTAQYFFSGAYSGIVEGALKWNGAWNVVPAGKPFDGAGDPESPTNVSIAAADTPLDYAFNGDYGDAMGYDTVAPHPADYYLFPAAVHYGSGTIQLGFATTTAMRGWYVAGFDAGQGFGRRETSPVAIRWHCHPSPLNKQPCVRTELGNGIAHGVDSYGDVVGDDRSQLHNPSYDGHPVLWRGGNALSLSQALGTAYAVADNGTIVGWTGGVWQSCNQSRNWNASGFVANANDARPRAQPLDPLVRNLGNMHVEAALGVAEDGRILVCVTKGAATSREQSASAHHLAILTPERI